MIYYKQIAKRVLFAVLAFALLGASAPRSISFSENSIDLVIRPQTPDEAFDYLWSTLGDMPFFRDNGYQVALPEDDLIRRLATGEEGLSGVDAAMQRNRFKQTIYQLDAFDPALDVLSRGEDTLRQVPARLRKFAADGAFKVFPRYQVLLTLYGPGGAYDPETGTITLFATEQGQFKGGGGIHTIVHEMVHLGIEDGIVRRFKLEHWEKERLVDLICLRGLADLLPDYRLQDSGEAALDEFVTAESLVDLPAAIRKYLEVNPRE